MDEKSLTLVRRSFLRLIPLSDVAAKVFWEHLTLMEPALKGMLQERTPQFDMSLSRLLARLIDSMGDPERMERLTRRLGYRFAGLGLTEERYGAAEKALFWTLRHLIKDAMTEETTAAWENVCTVLIQSMMEGAYSHRTPVECKAVINGREEAMEAVPVRPALDTQ